MAVGETLMGWRRGVASRGPKDNSCSSLIGGATTAEGPSSDRLIV